MLVASYISISHKHSQQYRYNREMNAICTISDANYATRAFAMLQSASEHMPDLYYFFLDIEGCKPQLRESQINVLSLKDLGFSDDEVLTLHSRYNVIEFATAVKPALLRTLLSRGFQTVTYLDPDILVLDSLDTVFSLSHDYEAILVPHRITPDNFSGSNLEIGFNRVGIFNLGFITTSQKSFELLEWWHKRVLSSASMNWFEGQFTDQKWADFFPSYFNVSILRHPGYNLAIWNIDERPLDQIDQGKILANGQPLLFVHFSQGSHRFENSDVMHQWGRASKTDIQILQSLALRYKMRVDYCESNLSFASQKRDRLKLKRPSFRVNFRDGLIAGIKLDIKYLAHKFKA